jgi:UDP-glucose 4-epimerase
VSVEKVLITGGDGFIGRYVQSRLKELNIEPIVYDVAADVRDDVLDRDRLGLVVATVKPDAIIHLAGMLGTHELWETISEAVDVNIKGAVNVADAAIAVDAKLVSIEQPHIWYNVYEATKLAARRILTGMAHDSDLRVDFVTAHNAYGPGQAHGDGHPQKIIPTFATKAWAGEPVPIWGTGQQKVNLVYVGDVADALIQRALSDWHDPEETFNAGTDELHTVKEIATLVSDRVDIRYNTNLEFHAMRRGEQDWVPYPEPDNSYPYRMNWPALYATIDSYRP